MRDLFPCPPNVSSDPHPLETKSVLYCGALQVLGVSCVPTVTLVIAMDDTVHLGHVNAVTATATLTPMPWPTVTAPPASVSSVSTTLEVSTVTSVSQVSHTWFTLNSFSSLRLVNIAHVSEYCYLEYLNGQVNYYGYQVMQFKQSVFSSVCYTTFRFQDSMEMPWHYPRETANLATVMHTGQWQNVMASAYVTR